MGDDDLIDPDTATDEQHAAACKIQAVQRGKNGRKRAKGKQDEKEAEEARVANNPKIGESSGDAGKLGKIRDKPAEAAEQSLEMMLQMFGKDGGAYLRKDEQRSCRDVPMCISLALYWLCMLFLLQTAQEKGDVDKLFYPVTFEGVSCGVKSEERDLTDYKSLYYPMPTTPELNFCVKQCPGEGTPSYTNVRAPFSSYVCHHDVDRLGRFATGEGPGINTFTDNTCNPTPMEAPDLYGEDGATCNWLNSVCGGGDASQCDANSPLALYAQGCQPSVGCIASKMYTEENGMGGCYHPIGKTVNILYQCVPTELAENATQMLKEMSGEMGSQHFMDLMEFSWVIGASFGIALVLAFIWILFLDYFAGPLIWLTVYASVLLMPVLGILLQIQSGSLTPPDQMQVPPEMQARMAEVQLDPIYAEYASYVCYSLAVVMAIVFFVFHDRITMSIGVIEEASDCFLSIPQAVLLPILTFALEVPIVFYLIYSTLSMLSMREYDPEADRYIYSDELQRMVLFNAFGLLWTMYVITSVQYTTIAGACADWYFTFPDEDGDRDVQMFAVVRSMHRVFRYSFGTMIFGALLIATVTVLKMVATYFINQIMSQSPENKIIMFFGHCLIFCVSCIEKFVRFLGKLAFIECAIYGGNFCTGIYKASKRLLKNIVRFSFLSAFAHIMIFLGKCGVVGCTILICNMIITSERKAEQDYDLPYAPLCLCGLAAALTVTLVMSVYETAIDTIMICFLEDEAENDGTGKPSFASGELAGFMKNTKSISDAAEQYQNDTRQAKTNRIRADNETHDKLKDSHAGVAAAKAGKGGGRSARARKKARKGEGSQPERYANPLSEDETE
eukprot:COSAG05_NODE_1683_length_4285_cov_2.403727_3_plen_844_part_00